MLFVRWDPDPSAAVQRTSSRTTAEGRVAGFRAFVTHNGGMRNPVTLLFLRLALFVLSRAPLSLVPSRSRLRAPLSRAHAHSDSQNCQRQRKLSQPLMVFERGRSDAKDERIHAGQITILPLSRQTGYSCWPPLLPHCRFRPSSPWAPVLLAPLPSSQKG